jgi:hypothetical protein
MREALPEQRFDLILNLFTSFGYFADPADDLRVARVAAAMLEAGGRFFVEVVNGNRIIDNFQERDWFTVGDTAVMERRALDEASRRMVVERTIERDGQSQVNTHAIRLYGARELDMLLRLAGFERVRFYGDWDGSAVSADSLRVLAAAAKEKGGS